MENKGEKNSNTNIVPTNIIIQIHLLGDAQNVKVARTPSLQGPLDLGIRNVQELTRDQTFLHPRDMNTGRAIPLSSGVELSDLLRVLH
jgi:hypothetical protein